MITFDYLIEREISEGKFRKFTPELIPTQLDGIVTIEGPNSSGKSTLLTIIALGLFGTGNKRINPTLQTKMDSLLDSKHQRITFSFKIISKDGDLHLLSEKTDLKTAEISVKESNDGKTYRPISPDNFERKYNLIYDIPNNPTERLPELLKEFKEEQLQFGYKVKDFGLFLRTVLAQISSSRDPNRLEELRAKLQEARSQKIKLDAEIPEQQKFLDNLEKNAYIRFYFYYSNMCTTLEKEVEIAEEKLKKFNKDGKKLTTQLSHERAKFATLQSQFTQKYNAVTPLIQGALTVLPRKENARFKIWKEINPFRVEMDQLSTIKIEALHYADLFSVEIERMQNESSFKDASMLQRILASLQEFEDSGLLIPKLKVTLGDIVKIIKDESKKSSILVKRYENIDDIVTLLNDLGNITDDIKLTLEKLKQESFESRKLSEKSTETYFGEKEELCSIKKNFELARSKRDGYLSRCVSKGINHSTLLKPYSEIEFEPYSPQLKQYLTLGESQTMEKIVDLQQEIFDKKRELMGNNLVITMNEKEAERLEKQKPHKYEEYRGQLTSLLQLTDAVSQKLLKEYNEDLESLINKELKVEDLAKNKERSEYYNEISKYLAQRIGVFRHIDCTYKAKTVNLISGIIATEDNTTIHIADMGTGQSQSAYLLSLLNAKNDNRKIIALFDEIAMMDESSLEPICQRLRELYNANRLLLGIMVQRGNQLSIRSLQNR